jgi:sensor histidine kinase YesM
MTSIFLNQSKFVKALFHVLFWLICFVVHFAVIINIKSFSETILRTSLNTLFFAIIFYQTRFYINRYYSLNKIGNWIKVIAVYIAGLGVARGLIEVFFFKTDIISIIDVTNQSLFYKFLISAIYVFLFTVMMLLVASIFSLFFIIKKRNEIESLNTKLKYENLENQLAFLNNQLSPHFLFNSLNDIYSAIVLKHSSAENMILKLSSIMRFIVYETSKNSVLLMDEIDEMKKLISFFEYKSKNELDSNITISENIKDVHIVPMMLIPLVENALKHGNFNDHESSYLKIQINYEFEILTISVENSYENKKSNPDASGIGIVNYKKRLELKYADRFQFDQSQSNNIFISTLKLNLSK